MVYQKTLRFSTAGEFDIIDITEQVEEAVEESGVNKGICLVFHSGSTGSVILNENDPSLLEDFKDVLRELVPHKPYRHPVNARSHLATMLLGPSVCLPVENGKLVRGTWQNIMFVELDTRPRERTVKVVVVGN